MPVAMKMKIGELARLSGCQVVTVRYYEKEGLLRCPERTESNYRLYDDEDLERLRFIRHCRLYGISLKEIRNLLAFRDNPECRCDRVHRVIEKHIKHINAQIASLRHLKGHLTDLISRCSQKGHPECGIWTGLNEEEHCPRCERQQHLFPN